MGSIEQQTSDFGTLMESLRDVSEHSFWGALDDRRGRPPERAYRRISRDDPTSDCDTARLPVQSIGERIADSVRLQAARATSLPVHRSSVRASPTPARLTSLG
jgi:hypothetical protein